MSARPDVSVVLPSYHGAQHAQQSVPLLIQCLQDLRLSHEVIIVDDGSGDGGATRAAAEDLGCLYLENPVNQGKGAAVRRGMAAATGRMRVFTDVDIPYQSSSLERMLFYLDAKEFHFVAGDRTLETSDYFQRSPLLRRVASTVYSTFVGRLVAGGWFDTQCGIKGFRDHVADDLFAVGRITRFAFDVELFYIALKRNYDIKRIPVDLRCNETSTVNVLRDGAAMVRDLWRIRLNQALGHYRPPEGVARVIDSHVEEGAAWRKQLEEGP